MHDFIHEPKGHDHPDTPLAMCLIGEPIPPSLGVDVRTYLAVKNGYLGGDTIEALAQRFKVSSRTISRWAAKACWPKGRDNRWYPDRVRRRAHELWNAGRTYSEIAQALGISSSTIYRWRNEYRWRRRRGA